jgi:S-adenosylmethionine synthetase
MTTTCFTPKSFYHQPGHAPKPDIAQGVDARAAEGKETDEQGAGDQGLMFGFACDETPELMPAPIMFAHRLGRELNRVRKAGKGRLAAARFQDPGFRPIRKRQARAHRQRGRFHPALGRRQTQGNQGFHHQGNHLKVLPAEMLDKKTQFLINPTGRFVVGGPQGDTGLTGRKIIVDSYGGMGRHGGGAFSGKDPSKVDRSAAYMGRYVAKNIVAAGLATRAEIQFAYAIGYPDPVSVCVDTFGTGVVSDEKIEQAVREVFSFKPAAIIKQLNLLRPIYSKTTNYGHFGKIDDLNSITWEKTDKAAALKKAAK